MAAAAAATATTTTTTPAEAAAVMGRNNNSVGAKLMTSGWKAFVVCRHPVFGYLLLSSCKQTKGPHYQLPGGRVDDEDFTVVVKAATPAETATSGADGPATAETGTEAAAKQQQPSTSPSSSSPLSASSLSSPPSSLLSISSPAASEIVGSLSKEIITEVCRYAAARELFEETGVDVRQNAKDRLKQIHFDSEKRCFFECILDDEKDSASSHMEDCKSLTEVDASSSNNNSNNNNNLICPINCPNKQFFVRISHEHNGAIFEKDPIKAAHLVHLHSKGWCTNAVLHYLAHGTSKNDEHDNNNKRNSNKNNNNSSNNN